MAAENEDKGRRLGSLISDRGKRDLLIGIALIGVPPLFLVVFRISIGANFYAVALLIGVFLIVRTWSRELNWHTLKRRFIDG